MQAIRKGMIGAVAMSAAAASAGAQQAAAKVAVRPLGAAVATSVETIGSLAAVRQLPGGNLLVNDQARRRVLLMDSTMRVIRVVADSTNAEANYGGRLGGLLAFRGDSTLFVDPASLSMLVIDPQGNVGRVMAAPRPNDIMSLLGGPFGSAGFDAQGRLVYRSNGAQPAFRPPQPGQPFTPPVFPDSAMVVRFDLASRKLDTAAFYKVYRPDVSVSQDPNGGMRVTTKINPIPVVDEWAVLSDGSIAIVRGRDYHVELIDPSGARRVAAKIPYDWQRLSDADKAALIDSTRTAFTERMRTANANGGAGGQQIVIGGGAGAPPMGGGGGQPQVMTMVMRGPGDAAPPARSGAAPAAGAANLQVTPNFVDPSALPDYKPVFAAGAVRADEDGRMWIRTIPTKPTPGGAIYDVIDGTGTLVDRVQVPNGTTIAGFGKGGVVYLGVRDTAGVHVVRARAK